MRRNNKIPTFAGYAISLAALLMTQAAMAAGPTPNATSPRVAADINNDPNIVEVNLTATETQVELVDGTLTAMWTYNDGTPGPTIEAKLGDTVIVNFTNNLPQGSTVHWHGVEVPAIMDGSNISQFPVPPGGTFRYEFRPLAATTYWYHSHINSNEQVERGLYGALIVRDPATDGALGLPETEHVMVLDDILLDDYMQIAEPFPDDPVENAITHVNGRQGNALLVNGHITPTMPIQRGAPQRLHMINVANARFMRVSIPGHTMYRIGGDGGLLETPIAIPPVEMIYDHHAGHMVSNPDPSQGLLLTPGERADVVFTPMGDKKITVEWHDIPHGKHSAFLKPDGSGIGLGHAHDDGKAPPKTLMTFQLTGPQEDAEEYIPPMLLRPIDPIDVAGVGKIILEFGHTAPNANGDITFFIQRKNGMGLPFDQVTPADAPIVVAGETRIIEVRNLTGGDHNFHLHGFFVQPIETQFIDMDNPDNNYVVPASHAEVKDTVHIPRRPGAMMRSQSITRLAVVFDDNGDPGDIVAYGKEPGPFSSGGWVMHCHILEHTDNGMMSFVQVIEN